MTRSLVRIGPICVSVHLLVCLAIIPTYFVPEVQCDDSFRYPITSSVDENFIYSDLVGRRSRGFWMYDLNIPIIGLMRFGDIYGYCVGLRNTTFRVLR